MEIEELRKTRKKLDLTQKELAKLANVSQSLIAKIESGKIDPAYSNAKKLFSALESVSKKHEEKASSFLTKKVVFTKKNEKLTEAVKKMKHYDISQLPVLDKERVIGLITETDILEMISQGKNITSLKVSDVMEESPPTISKNAPKDIVISLLKYSPIILVYENGTYKGVITKVDLLKSL